MPVSQPDVEQVMQAVTACHEGPGRNRPRVAPAASVYDSYDLVEDARALLDRLVRLQLLSDATILDFLDRHAEFLSTYTTEDLLAQVLCQDGLLTNYQIERVLAGTTHGLVLGNYRVLDRLGAGAMGVVFLGEHVLMKRQVAIKAMPVEEDCPPALLERFYSEMRVLADLHHPNVVLAFDAGKLHPAGPNMPGLLYLVMELVVGCDLELHVINNGIVNIPQACEWVRQAACGLQEAHDHHLIHRDVKPSNMLLSKTNQVKLVDFGLARQFCSRLTDPKALLGTLEYMAPEQSLDPSAVGAQADIYGLGGTLFWLLTGQQPFPPARKVTEALKTIQQMRPRKLRDYRPEAPAELEALIDRLLEKDPALRPATPLTLMNDLLPFTMTPSIESRASGLSRLSVTGLSRMSASASASGLSFTGVSNLPISTGGAGRVLVVDDEASCRRMCTAALRKFGHECMEAADGASALSLARTHPFDLILLDLILPDLDGYEVCRRLRERPRQTHMKLIIVSGKGDQDQLAEALTRGADDYIPKPFAIKQLEAKVQHALQLKEAQDRAEMLSRQLLLTNRQLESTLGHRDTDVQQAQDALLFAMAKMAESRDGETSGHLRRLQRYCRCLAQEAVKHGSEWAQIVDPAFLQELERCVPLHDIGKMGLPDQVLLKPGKLTPAERTLMETHTIIGDRILDSLSREHGTSLAFLKTAISIVRHHHERFDGKGYPDRLAGDAIPAAARIVAVADVYDALRRLRVHKPALPHAETVRILLERSEGQFDPTLIAAFRVCQEEFEGIYRAIPT